MRKVLIHAVGLCLLHVFCAAAFAQGTLSPRGDRISGWVDVIGSEATWTVDGEVITATGTPRSVLRTDRQYENYVLTFEYRSESPSEGAGLILHGDALPAAGLPWPRGIGVRLDDRPGRPVIAPIGGALVEPVVLPRSEEAAHAAGTDRGWRRARIESRDGHVAVEIDGRRVATANYASPRKGYIALQSDGSEVRFRNVRIEELPSTDPAPYEVAEVDRGFVSLYDGVDLSNSWEMKPGHRGHWTARDWVIDYDGGSEERDKSLWSKKAYGDFVLIADVRLTREPEPDMLPVVLPSGLDARDADGNTIMVEVPYAGDTGIYLRGSSKSQINMGNRYIGSGDVYGYRADPKMPPEVRRAVTPRVKADHPPGEWDRYVITMKGDRLSVVLNGHTIIDDARLPGVDPTGKIALQDDHASGNTFQFANLYIMELE